MSQALAAVVLVGGAAGAWGVDRGVIRGPWAERGAAAVPGVVTDDAGADERAAAVRGPVSSPPRRVHVVRLVPRGFSPDPAMSPAAVTRAVEGASAYWSSQSAGAVSFEAVSVSEWIGSGAGCGDVSALWDEARRRVPEADDPRAHLVVVAPRAAGDADTGCDFGYGSLGHGGDGGATYVTALHPELLAHELGHNLGLGHASALECDGAQDGTWDGRRWSAGCRVRAYDDLFDVMGYSGEGFGGGQVGAVGIDRGGLDPVGVRTVTGSVSDVRLLPMSQVGRGVRVLRVRVPGEPTYYVEYRTATGRDAAVVAGAWRPTPGVRILRADPSGGDSLELDATPGGRRYDRALPVGSTFVSASGGVRIDLVAADEDGASLTVTTSRG